MTLLAIIDATDLRAPDGPATQVAGLSLVERALRLATVCDADELLIVAPPDCDSDDLGVAGEDRPIPLSIISPGSPFSPAEEPTTLLILDAGAVHERSAIQSAVRQFMADEKDQARRDATASVALIGPGSSAELRAAIDDPARARRAPRPLIDEGWIIEINTSEDAAAAARRLWNSCRKPQDGLVSRYLNRHLSISISKVLAPTWIKPNHISAVTFTLGIVAAVAAGWGGYVGFLLAGLLYQANSVIDGVDGELARVRYEFSVLGEWLDTISDDVSDFLMYIGLGIGAWRTLADAPGPFDSEAWLILGIIAAVAKLATMAVYYRWLIAHGRGDLLAFQWDFRDDDGKEKGPIVRLLSFCEYFFRKDFIVFAAMILAIAGYLPYLLIALAPGNAIVAVSVLIQQARNSSS